MNEWTSIDICKCLFKISVNTCGDPVDILKEPYHHQSSRHLQIIATSPRIHQAPPSWNIAQYRWTSIDKQDIYREYLCLSTNTYQDAFISIAIHTNLWESININVIQTQIDPLWTSLNICEHLWIFACFNSTCCISTNTVTQWIHMAANVDETPYKSWQYLDFSIQTPLWISVNIMEYLWVFAGFNSAHSICITKVALKDTNTCKHRWTNNEYSIKILNIYS